MMMNIIKAFLFVIGALSLITCSEDEITSREYPRVRTLAVSNVSKAGATFNGEIIHEGNESITEYGFVWASGANPVILASEQAILDEEIKTGRFSVEILSTLEEGLTYNVRAYAKNNEYLVYGTTVSFTSLGSSGP